MPRTREQYNEYMRKYMADYAAKRRQMCLDELGGVCQRPGCGSTEDLEFHHRDPSEKSFAISQRWHRPWEQTLAELQKCDLVCGACHKKEHKSTAPHGTPQRYWRGCKCTDCKQAYNAHNRAYAAKRRKEKISTGP